MNIGQFLGKIFSFSIIVSIFITSFIFINFSSAIILKNTHFKMVDDRRRLYAAAAFFDLYRIVVTLVFRSFLSLATINMAAPKSLTYSVLFPAHAFCRENFQNLTVIIVDFVFCSFVASLWLHAIGNAIHFVLSLLFFLIKLFHFRRVVFMKWFSEINKCWHKPLTTRV